MWYKVVSLCHNLKRKKREENYKFFTIYWWMDETIILNGKFHLRWMISTDLQRNLIFWSKLCDCNGIESRTGQTNRQAWWPRTHNIPLPVVYFFALQTFKKFNNLHATKKDAFATYDVRKESRKMSRKKIKVLYSRQSVIQTKGKRHLQRRVWTEKNKGIPPHNQFSKFVWKVERKALNLYWDRHGRI